jgi:hypothetical protein
MEHMRDKEFDKLFQQRFEGFEVEPVQASWSNVSQILNNNQEEKNSYQSYYAVAATIAVIISVGTWFSNSGEKVRLYGKAKVTEPVEEHRAIVPQATYEPYARVEETGRIEKKKQAGRISPPGKESVNSVSVKGFQDGADFQELKPEEVTMLAKEQKNQVKVEEKALASTPDTAWQAWPFEDNDWEKEQQALAGAVKNRKTVGDLINFVISRVDKRKDKIIEFTDTDEGSIVSGINLGLVRFKSKQ